MSDADNVEIATPAKIGRPSKAAIAAKKKRGAVGRPAGDSARIAEFKARLLSTSGSKVIDKILATALEDGHPAQAACMKMCFDRILPASMFDKDANGGGSKPTITINIAGITDSVTIEQSSDDVVEDGEWEDG